MAPWQIDAHMACMIRVLGLPNIPVNKAFLKERTPWTAHTSHCGGLQPWDTMREVQWASRSQISTIGFVHPVHGIPGQEHSCQVQHVQAAERVVGMRDSQLGKSQVQHMMYLRKPSSSIWPESLRFLDIYITRLVRYFGNISGFCVIFLKPFVLQINF